MEEGWLVVVILAVLCVCLTAVAFWGRKLKQRTKDADYIHMEIWPGLIAGILGVCSIGFGINRHIQGKYRNLDDGKGCQFDFNCKSGSKCKTVHFRKNLRPAKQNQCVKDKQNPTTPTTVATTTTTVTPAAKTTAKN